MTATQPPFQLDEKGPRSSREAREASRAARNGANSHYRRARSPQSDDWNDEPVSPVSDVKLEDARAILANAQGQVCIPTHLRGLISTILLFQVHR